MPENATGYLRPRTYDAKSVLSKIAGAITHIQRGDGKNTAMGWSQASVNIICGDRPGTLVDFTDFLQREHHANILDSFGARQCPDIHSSNITIEISDEELDDLIEEFKMNATGRISIPDQPIIEERKLYNLVITGPDQRGIFSQIGRIFTIDNRDINILSYGIRSKQIEEYDNLAFAYIKMCIEVPTRIIPSITIIFDEIRGLGHGLWKIANADEKDDAPFSRISFERIEQLN